MLAVRRYLADLDQRAADLAILDHSSSPSRGFESVCGRQRGRLQERRGNRFESGIRREILG
jgi:hypothetical protein